ncbi:MAG: glycosyltransferase family 4 protein [Pseudomonadota bacterium]
MRHLIFQLGTNNWQRQGEFAPGSGILHEAHHHAFNDMPEVTCYSVYPSKVQTSDDPQVSIFPLEHDIPICESISPVSSYRFHGMSEHEFGAYVNRLQNFTRDQIDAAEKREGRELDLAIAHHSFLNPLVLSRINRERVINGRAPFMLMCFVHGTALKMFAHEKSGTDPEYPARFLPFMQKHGVFDPDGNVDACAAISTEQLSKFSDVFPDYPRARMILSPNGYDTGVFKPDMQAYRTRESILRGLELPASPVRPDIKKIDSHFNHVVVFCGKFADWKRLDCLLHAAAVYEKRGDIATLIVGSGPDEAITHYHDIAYRLLGLRNTWFLGPRSHSEIAQLNSMADLGVYPSRNEPFGLVLIECMACGTPVIGANSGGPRDFVNAGVGELIDEGDNAQIAARLSDTITRALSEEWKMTKGATAAQFAREHYSVERQCAKLLDDVVALKQEISQR